MFIVANSSIYFPPLDVSQTTSGNIHHSALAHPRYLRLHGVNRALTAAALEHEIPLSAWHGHK